MKTSAKVIITLATLFIFGFAPVSESATRLNGAAAKLRYAKYVDTNRIEAIIDDTYEAAAQSPLFKGPAGTEATALLVYAVMYHESGLRPHIERCDCTKGDGTCDNGHAFGLPQLHAEWLQGYPKSEVCSNRPLQVRLALDLLQKMKDVCHGGSEHWTAAYHSGFCETSGYGHNVNDVFVTLLKQAKIAIHGPAAVFLE